MYLEELDLNTLVKLARRGHAQAAALAKTRLARQMPHIVRRAIAEPVAHDHTARMIQEEARQVGPDGWKPGLAYPERLLQLVARRVMITVTHQLTRSDSRPQWEADSVAVA